MSEHVLVVYGHPYQGSLNHAILKAVVRGIEAAGDTAEVCDLYADGFDPALRVEELALYGKGAFADPLVGTYMEQLSRATRLVIVAPVWWNDIPAIVKGWFDKVMLLDFSWVHGKEEVQGRLTHIRRVDIYSTSSTATDLIRERLGDCFDATVIGATCRHIGIYQGAWHNLGRIQDTTLEERRAFIAQAEADQKNL